MAEISDPQQFVHWFRHSSPYINAHRGRTFVIHIPGDVVAREDFNNLVHDLALLNNLGIKLVLVHGAQPQVEARLSEAGISTQRVSGLRVTDSEVLPRVLEAVGLVRTHIESQLSMGVANSPMAGAKIRVISGNLITARPLGVVDGVDFQHTGEVRRVDVEAIRNYLHSDCIVLLSPLGYSPTGEVFSLGAEDVAIAVAHQIHADKLISFLPGEGLLDENGEVIHQLTLSQANTLFPQLPEEQHTALSKAIRACQLGIERVHLLGQQQPGALLLELFSRSGSGTLISAEEYDHVRSANIEDVGGILQLIEPLEQAGVLVRRSRELLEMEIEHFVIMERDGMIIACAALYPLGDNMAELACFAVHPEYQKQGRGDAMLSFIESKALEQQLDRLCVLSTRTAHWFQERGFAPANIDDLPAQRQKLYNYQRRSKVFIKLLTPGRRTS